MSERLKIVIELTDKQKRELRPLLEQYEESISSWETAGTLMGQLYLHLDGDHTVIFGLIQQSEMRAVYGDDVIDDVIDSMKDSSRDDLSVLERSAGKLTTTAESV